MSEEHLAKITWTHPQTSQTQEFVLAEGATATIGRSSTNDIHIPEKHVSRQHAVINYRNGVFMVSDTGSSNGTFVNDQQITEPFPLAHGDIIRLFVPILTFSAVVSTAEQQQAKESGKLITAAIDTGNYKLIITNGEQEGQEIPLRLQTVTIGRASTKATWEIGLQDPSVSRPHARLEQVQGKWMIKDLGSSNGTSVNGKELKEDGHPLRDGDLIALGATRVLFRAG